MKRIAIAMLLVFLAGAAFCQGCFPECWEKFDKSPLPWPEKNEVILQSLIGCQAPVFNVMSIQGNTLNLEKLQGKVVVINFWFTTCAPCVAEMPALNRLTKLYKKDEVIFIAFAKNSVEEIADFKTTFLYHQVSSSYDVSTQYCMMGGWPMHVVLDKQGVVRHISTGGYTDERANNEAFDLLKPVIDMYIAK
jgi:thiol-disulfide isomerase/thioredoxin